MNKISVLEDTLNENNITEKMIYDYAADNDIDFSGKFFVGVCYGLVTDESQSDAISYEKYAMLKNNIYNKIQELFYSLKIGFVIQNEYSSCNLIAIIPLKDNDSYIDKYLLKIKATVESEYGIDLCIGVGKPTRMIEELEISCKTAKYAYGLYFFVQKELIIYDDEAGKTEEIPFDVYDELLEEVYHLIVAKDEKVYEKINEILDFTEKFYFGNRSFAINHLVIFMGEMGKKLKELNRKKADFREEQAIAQEKFRHQNNYQSVRKIVLDFFENLIPRIHHNIGQGNISESVEIKKYIEKNYMKDFTLKELADAICISHGYSSTFFKNAMGKNFRSYLTGVRMEEALKMVLQTDMKTYEISEAVGYNSVRRFVDAFRNVYKMSPMEYRKEFKKV